LVCIENCAEDNLIINIEKQTERQVSFIGWHHIQAWPFETQLYMHLKNTYLCTTMWVFVTAKSLLTWLGYVKLLKVNI